MRGSVKPEGVYKVKLPDHLEKVKICLLDGTIIDLDVSETTRCSDCIEMIAIQIELRVYLDFKLYLTESNDERVLDDDEILLKAIKKS